MKKNLLIIDPRVTYYQFHVDALNPQTDAWYLLEQHQDGISQIATIVKAYQDLASIQILSYVDSGAVLLGSTLLSEHQLNDHELALKKMGAHLAKDGQLILALYGAAKKGIKSTYVNHLSILVNKPVSVFTAPDESSDLTLSINSFKPNQAISTKPDTIIPPEVLAEISASVDELINTHQTNNHAETSSQPFTHHPFNQQFLDAYANQHVDSHWPKNWQVKPLALAVTMTFSTAAVSEPTGGQVTAGQATINQAGAVTTINQASQKAAIDWHTFNVKGNEAVNFNQPNASAITLNRVTGTESSSIMGSVTANGKVFILNPNGVLIGAGAQVNVGGLVASTLNLSNANFMADNFNFTGNGAGSVVNQGNINIAEGGMLALIAPVVKNTGTVVADQGNVLLAAADDVTLTLLNGNMVSYTLNKGSVQTLIDNGGLIQADGGHVVLTAKGIDALSRSAINHTGIIEAQTVSSKEGKIELLGDMQIGELNVAGKLDASAPTNGNGGFVETSAAKVNVADSARVTTLAANGNNGTWLIDPTDFTVSATGGDMTGQSVTNALAGGSFIIDSDNGSSGTGGNVYINDAINWSANTLRIDADNNIYINKNLNGSGTAMLAFNFGLGTADGGASDYFINGAKINLPEGLNFATKKGLNGAFTPYQVITRLGVEGDTSTSTLQGIKNNLSGNYVLGNDVDASVTSSWGNGVGFESIGGVSNNAYTAFTGKLDGLGHNITNLHIAPIVNSVNGYSPTNDTGYKASMFSNTSFASIRNLNLLGGEIIAGNSNVAGSLVGLSHGSKFYNIYSSVDVVSLASLGSPSVGGLVGQSAGLTECIKCISTGNVQANRGIAGGLFGYALSGTVLEDSHSTGSVEGYGNTGGLVGYSAYNVIKNSYAIGNVKSLNGIAGGLIGYSLEDAISNSYASGNVASYFDASGESYRLETMGSAGGLIGEAAAPQITNSYSSGSVSGHGAVGGLIGVLTTGNSLIHHISNSYSNSNVMAFNPHPSNKSPVTTGGLIGYMRTGMRSYYGVLAALENTYSTGTITTEPNYIGVVGGLVGHDATLASIQDSVARGFLTQAQADGLYSPSLFIKNNFWDNTKSNVQMSVHGTGKTTAEMQQQSTYTGWDFDTIWRISPGDYPRLRALTQGTIVVETPNLGLAGPNVNKIYDGVAVNTIQDLSTLNGWLPAYNGLTVTGLQQGDSLTNASIFSGMLNYDGTWQGAKNAGSYTIVPSGIQSQKYEIVYTNGSLNITPRPLTATITGNLDKVYDGTTDAVFNWNQIQLNGFAPNEGGHVVCIGCNTEGGLYSSKNAGVRTVEANFIDDDIIPNQNTLLSNYILPEVATGTGEITPRPLTIQALNTIRAEGDANPTSVTTISNGLVEGETITKVSVSVEATASPTAKSGSEHDINPTGVEIANGEASNYSINYKTGTLTITPKDYQGKDWWKNGITESERQQLRQYQAQLNAVKDEIALADAVYSFTVPEGYVLINTTSNPLTGFAAATYRNITTGKYSVVFRGSESPLSHPNDWLNNVSHAVGVPAQYSEGLIYTQNAISAYGEVSLVGHSLGGGIAMYSAAMTGSNATTFNPAKLWSTSTALVVNFTPNNGTGSVKNFVFDNEIVQFAGTDFGYFGGFNKINLYTEGLLGDHYLTHVNSVKSAIDLILANTFVYPDTYPDRNGVNTGTGSVMPDSGAVVVSNTRTSVPEINLNMDRIITAHNTLNSLKSYFNWNVAARLLNPSLTSSEKFQIWGDFLNSHTAELDILDAHRQYMNSSLPASVHELMDIKRSGDTGWEIVNNPDETIYHQNGIGKPELKFVNSDGREAVYDGDTGLLISEGDAAGTYNFTTNEASPSGHALDDILLSREAYRYYLSHQNEKGVIDDIERKIEAAIASKAVSIGSYIGL